LDPLIKSPQRAAVLKELFSQRVAKRCVKGQRLAVDFPNVIAPGNASIGTRGRRFKSCHSDQHLPELSVQTGTTSGTDTPAADGILSARKMARPRESIRKIPNPLPKKTG
jgi:hypothetical protein